MSLTGDVNTLALADLVQVSAMNRRTCQIHVMSPDAEGDLYLDRGAVVHAWWGDLVGAEAVYAMLNTPDVGFHVRADIAVEAHTVAASWQHLVLEAARRHDHGSVPRPTMRTSARWKREADPLPPPHRSDSFAQPLPNQQRADSFARPLSLDDAMVRKGPPRALWLAATLFVVAALGLVGWRAWRKQNPVIAASMVPAEPKLPRDPVRAVDAAELTGPGDAPPQLLDGAPPPLPRSDWAVAPTIVCRLTIDRDGRVQKSQVYRSRLDLAAFEDAALAAVDRYRFRPAQRNHQAVAVTINWPVTFAASNQVTRIVKIKGSDTIGGELAPALGRAFSVEHGDVEVGVEALGSKTAFVGLFDGTADLGASSRPVGAEELKQAARLGVTLREFVLAYDGVAVIVNPANPVQQLSLDDVAKIFTGEITQWSDIGGANEPITVISRPSYSGTQSFFRDKVLRHGDSKGTQDFVKSARIIEDNKALVAAVAADKNAIAFVGNGWLGPSVRALPVNGILPSTATIRDGTYPIYRPLLFYTRGAPTRDAAAFLTFVLGAAGQTIVREHGFVPIDAPATPIAVGDDAAAGAPREPLRIQFRAAGTRLDAPAIGKLAALARASKGQALLVVGHSDAEGDAATNHRLALQRAERVAQELVALGVARGAVSVESDDADAPLATNGSVSGRRMNRRADVFLLPK